MKGSGSNGQRCHFDILKWPWKFSGKYGEAYPENEA